MPLDIQEVVIHTGKLYHRGTWDLEEDRLLLHPGAPVYMENLRKYTELPEDVLVEELCDRCFPRGE